MGLIDDALSANATLAAGYDSADGGPPKPKMAIVTCADPRLSGILRLLGLAEADVDMIRNVGTVVDDSFTDAEAATREQVAKTRQHPWISPDVAVRGFVFDVDTGRLSEVRLDASATR